jgi:hypothetical protein
MRDTVFEKAFGAIGAEIAQFESQHTTTPTGE